MSKGTNILLGAMHNTEGNGPSFNSAWRRRGSGGGVVANQRVSNSDLSQRGGLVVMFPWEIQFCRLVERDNTDVFIFVII